MAAFRHSGWELRLGTRFPGLDVQVPARFGRPVPAACGAPARSLN